MLSSSLSEGHLPLLSSLARLPLDLYFSSSFHNLSPSSSDLHHPPHTHTLIPNWIIADLAELSHQLTMSDNETPKGKAPRTGASGAAWTDKERVRPPVSDIDNHILTLTQLAYLVLLIEAGGKYDVRPLPLLAHIRFHYTSSNITFHPLHSL